MIYRDKAGDYLYDYKIGYVDVMGLYDIGGIEGVCRVDFVLGVVGIDVERVMSYFSLYPDILFVVEVLLDFRYLEYGLVGNVIYCLVDDRVYRSRWLFESRGSHCVRSGVVLDYVVGEFDYGCLLGLRGLGYCVGVKWRTSGDIKYDVDIVFAECVGRYSSTNPVYVGECLDNVVGDIAFGKAVGRFFTTLDVLNVVSRLK